MLAVIAALDEMNGDIRQHNTRTARHGEFGVAEKGMTVYQ
jgi:hypothetical protein